MKVLTGTRGKIFNVSIDLFSKYGYNGVSIRKIASIVGIKESSIYNHFENKEDILNCIFDYFHEGMLAQRPDQNELEQEIEFIAPREVFKLLFIKYGKNRDSTINKTARIILMEQYINPKAKDFVKEFMLEEPVNYYEAILRAMASKGNIRDNTDLRIAAEELNYGFLGILFDFAATLQEGGDYFLVLQKLSNHVDFVFERLEK